MAPSHGTFALATMEAVQDPTAGKDSYSCIATVQYNSELPIRQNDGVRRQDSS